jgi:hypothetical protein
MPQLAPGEKPQFAPPTVYGSGAIYRSAIIGARQRDPQPANNAVGWLVTGQHNMVMNALYLTPGSSAKVTLVNYGATTSLALKSADPSVATVPAAATFATAGDPSTTFTVTALKPGTTTISVTSAQYGQLPDTLPVTVVAPGTSPRFPVALSAQRDFNTGARFDQVTRFTATMNGTAPLSGASAGGVVTVSRDGHELGRGTLDAKGKATIDFYPDEWGTLHYDVAYAGDANFLPATQRVDVFTVTGQATITGGLQRTGTAGTFALTVRVQGSPVKPPRGTITVFSDGKNLGSAPLTVGRADATASMTLTGLPSSPTISVSYSGDGYHGGASQTFRVTEAHRRTVGH